MSQPTLVIRIRESALAPTASPYAQVKAVCLGLLFSLVQAAAVIFTGPALAEVSSHVIGEFTNYPILSSETTAVTPMVMINTSNDHQLYHKAYNDYTDLDPKNDDGIEITYKHAIDYYGYFDSYKCYDYDAGDGRFEPAAITEDKYCSGNWSGNFLNWASMARIDTIRKILFGGTRRIDTEQVTVLERTYLPNDAHSWTKHYSGADINHLTPFGVSELTLCNTTVAGSQVSEDVDTSANPPLIRVANGNHSLWASNERWQCRWSEEKGATNANDSSQSGIPASSSNPTKSSQGLGSGDYNARVQACVSGLIGKESCRYYQSGYYKPRGLLQVYGEDDQLYFGMTGGSYSKNKSGGILIKDVSSITDEIDLSNGRFKLVSAEATDGGVANNRSEGIINTWSQWRIVKYKHSDGTYGTGGTNNNNCTWGVSGFKDGECMNWGNPYAEIYLNSLRYLAGEPVSGTFRANDSNELPGLNTPQTWKCPLDDTNYCASLNIINFNSSVISYDADDLDGNSDGVQSIGAGQDSAGLTDVVGAGEGIHGHQYFVGENGTGDNNQLCTAKTVSSLGDVKGLCTEAPRLEGSYRLAGLAHWAHTNDIRPSSAGPRALDGNQLVDTYSVALASGSPEIEIPVPGAAGKTARILPACRNLSATPVAGNCALVDFKVVEKHLESGGIGTGKFYVNWEDSEQGGDYDQDMWGIIEYEITSSTVKITTDVIAKSTPFKMGFGYVTSGTTNDGFHVHSGINKFSYSDTTGAPDCDDCRVNDDATFMTYNIGASSASLLKDPLYYAAKWGSFRDQNGNGKPDLQVEWDNRDSDWIKGNQDGIPDNYFYATDPAALEAALIQIFEDILSKVASGTAAAVVSNSREGRGAIYQALYETQRKNNVGDEVRWIGTVRAFWIDEYGLMHEDSNQNGVLDAGDQIINITYDENRNTVVTQYYAEDADGNLTMSKIADGINAAKPIWDASEMLTQMAPSSRKIYTWTDTDYDGVAVSGEMIELSAAEIDASNFGFLDVADEAAADKIVGYIRGTDSVGLRSRTLDGVTYRLGDIVNSTPTVVGAPSEAFDLLYQDESYGIFRKKYKDRRQVIYVGANDGMLHAFNGGYFGLNDAGNNVFSPGGKPLGQELWAYVPMNLLPHLKWLADPDYTHVFYMDAKTRVFDAKIFAADEDHPGGWGTVLVAGMRLGGGPMTIDTKGDGLGGNKGADDMTMQSAYVLLDITNPEGPPEVLAEITHEDLGYTTSYPTAFAARATDDSENSWYLVFGSGPSNAGTATRDDGEKASLYIYDLVNRQFAAGYGPKVVGAENTFLNNPVSVDWDLSFKADALYFGLTGGTAEVPTGQLYKMDLHKSGSPGQWDSPALLFDAGQPITATPTVAWDFRFNKWVFFATGRLFVEGDQQSKTKQTIYGFRDVGKKVKLGDLVDVTGVKTYSNGIVTGISEADGKSSGSADGVVTTKELVDYINVYDSGSDGPDKLGWYKDMPYGNTDFDADDEPSTRSFNTSALIAEVLFTSAYTPGDHLCDAQGRSSLYGLYYLTGTASSELSILGTDETDTNTTAEIEGERLIETVDLGVGLASSPSLHIDQPVGGGVAGGGGGGVAGGGGGGGGGGGICSGGSGGGGGQNSVTVITQTGVGAIEKRTAKTGSSLKSGEVSWREDIGCAVNTPASE